MCILPEALNIIISDTHKKNAWKLDTKYKSFSYMKFMNFDPLSQIKLEPSFIDTYMNYLDEYFALIVHQ